MFEVPVRGLDLEIRASLCGANVARKRGTERGAVIEALTKSPAASDLLKWLAENFEALCLHAKLDEYVRVVLF